MAGSSSNLCITASALSAVRSIEMYSETAEQVIISVFAVYFVVEAAVAAAVFAAAVVMIVVVVMIMVVIVTAVGSTAAYLFYNGAGEELLSGEIQLAEYLTGGLGRGTAFLSRDTVVVSGNKQ